MIHQMNRLDVNIQVMLSSKYFNYNNSTNISFVRVYLHDCGNFNLEMFLLIGGWVWIVFADRLKSIKDLALRVIATLCLHSISPSWKTHVILDTIISKFLFVCKSVVSHALKLSCLFFQFLFQPNFNTFAQPLWSEK